MNLFVSEAKAVRENTPDSAYSWLMNKDKLLIDESLRQWLQVLAFACMIVGVALALKG